MKSKVFFFSVLLGLVFSTSIISQKEILGQKGTQDNKQDDKISISGVEQQVTTECDGKAVSVSGTTNIITLTGYCPRVTVTGTNNKVSIEKTVRITVSGASNIITYQEAVNRKNAIISKSGVNNSVRKL